MDKLSEELTPELLGLVLGIEVDYMVISMNTLHSFYNISETETKWNDKINIDTLTRLMKEWCWDNGFSIQTRYCGDMVTYTIVDATKNDDFIVQHLSLEKTEFEAVLKATHWVAKEKGLLK